MGDITYEYATVLYNSADVEYDGGQKDIDKWALAQEFDGGVDITTGTGSWSLVGTANESWNPTSVDDTQTTTYPTGTQAGDLLLFFMYGRRMSPSSFDVPAEWTQGVLLSHSIGLISYNLVVFFRVAGTETSVTTTAPGGTGSRTAVGILHTFGNAALRSDEIDSTMFASAAGSTTATNTTASPGNITMGAVTTNIVNNLGVYAACTESDSAGEVTWTDPSGINSGGTNETIFSGSLQLHMRTGWEVDADGAFASRTFSFTWSPPATIPLTGYRVAVQKTISGEVDAWQVIP